MRMQQVLCVQQNKTATGPDLLVLYFCPKAQISVGPPTVYQSYYVCSICSFEIFWLLDNQIVISMLILSPSSKNSPAPDPSYPKFPIQKSHSWLQGPKESQPMCTLRPLKWKVIGQQLRQIISSLFFRNV